MATTYTLISSNTLSSSAASITFSSIPSTYTDLVLRISARTDIPGANQDCWLRYNSSTANNYSDTTVYGDSSTAGSYRSTNASYITIGPVVGATATSNTFSNQEIYIPSYIVSQKKPGNSFSVAENNSATAGNAYIYLVATNWALTNSITDITVLPSVSPTYKFVSGSSFYLYGIRATP